MAKPRSKWEIDECGVREGIRNVASDKHTTLAINKGAIHGETDK